MVTLAAYTAASTAEVADGRDIVAAQPGDADATAVAVPGTATFALIFLLPCLTASTSQTSLCQQCLPTCPLMPATTGTSVLNGDGEAGQAVRVCTPTGAVRLSMTAPKRGRSRRERPGRSCD